MNRAWLWTEWALLFVLAPLVIGLTLRQAPWILLLGAVTAGAAVWLLGRGRFQRWRFWRGENRRAERQQCQQMLRRFALCAVGLTVLTLALFPDRLFAMPREMPLQWAVLLVTYPLLSVYPQELLYRAFFVRRYRVLFPRAETLLLASTLVFAWLHVIFRNPIAVLLTLVGGWFFAQTYARTGSLRLVCLEHTLYGSLIFSVGLGEYFLQSALLR